MSTSKPISDAYNPLTKPDTNNATYIGWDEIHPSEEWMADFRPLKKRDYWKLQNENNSGLRNGKRWNNPYETYRTNRDLILNLTSHLYIRPNQRSRATDLITRLDLQKLGLPAEQVAVGIIAYVIHDSEDDPRRGHPTPGMMDAIAGEIRDLQRSLGITDKQFRSVYAKVQHRDGRAASPELEHDRYEVDTNAQQRWRVTMADTEDD